MLLQTSLSHLINQQRQFFQSNQTKDINFRIEQLKRLKQAILDYEQAIEKALKSDLGKPDCEGYITELGLGLVEINHALKHIKSWTKPKKVSVPITQFPATAQVCPEPLGVVLIIGAWNYPFQLSISPLVGAIAAGNCAILKPSEVATHTSNLLSEMISKYFDSAFIAVVEGGKEVAQQLLDEKFDHIFFTGGTQVGRIVMSAAAKHLTPVTLELGGKSPCIVDANTHLDYTARRLVWGKFINAGQTCLAPDYLLANRSIKNVLLERIKFYIQEFYGTTPATSPDYARIINSNHFERLCNLLGVGEIVIGGDAYAEELYIAPTVIDQVDWNAPVMQEEIFGPILPVLEYTDLSEAIAIIQSQPKPLALYFFSNNPQHQQRILQETSSGSICFNDTVVQFACPELPFGGVGDSGIGHYHGKASFDTFSHLKSVLHRSFLADLKLRYPPYKNKLKILKWLLK
jgi:acyl-CoA reductase-like NAD-dependent aldehyde dehydrogenase